MKDEYKLVAKKEVTNLKIKESVSSKVLRESMDNLSDAINELVNLFTVAKEVGQEGNPEGSNQQDGMKSLLEQNEAIAAGILAITQILKEYLPKLVHISQETPKYKILRVKKRDKPNSYNPRPSSTETTSDFSASNPSINEEEEFSQN